MNSVQFIQVKLTKNFLIWDLILSSVYTGFCLIQGSLYTGFTVYIYIYVCACDCRTNIIVLHALTTGCYMTS